MDESSTEMLLNICNHKHKVMELRNEHNYNEHKLFYLKQVLNRFIFVLDRKLIENTNCKLNIINAFDAHVLAVTIKNKCIVYSME